MTILVIDDDPLIASLIQALDPTWHVVSALDGLTGLDLLRHAVDAGSPPDLIILDINMPGFDGYDTCLLIRAVAPTLPVVPFTQVRDDARLPRYMHELHCLHPVYKGIEPAALRQRLHMALRDGRQSTPQATSAVFERLLQKACEAEQQARRALQRRLRIGLFAPSLVQHLGLRQLLEAVGEPALSMTPIYDPADEAACVDATWSILVAAGADVQGAVALCQRRACPLLLIGHTLQEGAGTVRMLQALTPPITAGVVLADHTVMRHVPAALHQLSTGSSYMEPLLRPENAPRLSHALTERQLLPDLTPRLVELVVLDFYGWTTAQISEHLQISPATIETYWSRIVERLDRNREAARVWVRQQFKRRGIVDQLRAYLEIA